MEIDGKLAEDISKCVCVCVCRFHKWMLFNGYIDVKPETNVVYF